MRTGVLSDDYIMNNVCVEYRPVPLGKVGNILTPEMKPKHGLELRAAKYARPPPRPATFQSMSNSLSNQADPTNPLPLQQQLAKQYEQELQPSVTANEPSTPPRGESSESQATPSPSKKKSIGKQIASTSYNIASGFASAVTSPLAKQTARTAFALGKMGAAGALKGMQIGAEAMTSAVLREREEPESVFATRTAELGEADEPLSIQGLGLDVFRPQLTFLEAQEAVEEGSGLTSIRRSTRVRREPDRLTYS